MTGLDHIFWPAPVRKRPFVDHVRAAAAAGCDGLAVAPTTYDDERSAGRSARDMLRLAADHGVRLAHFDTLPTWAPNQLDPDDYDAEMNRRWGAPLDHCLAICEELGLRQILAVAAYQQDGVPRQQLVDGFGALCARAERLGIWVDLEPMPFFGCKTVAAAWDVVGGSGAANAGVMMDAWHFFKAGQAVADLDAIPDRAFRTLQLSDAPRRQVEAKLIDDTLKHRQWPGEGELPVGDLIRSVVAKGHLRAVGQEVFSLEADALDALAAGRKAGETTRAVLTAAGVDLSASKARLP